MASNRNRDDHYRDVAGRFHDREGGTTITIAEAVAWGMGQGMLCMSDTDQQEYHAERMRKALQSCRNSNNNRLWYCVEAERPDDEGQMRQQHLWAHYTDVSSQFVMLWYQQQRAKVRAHMTAVDRDLAFLNATLEAKGQPVVSQLSWDFAAMAGGAEDAAAG